MKGKAKYTEEKVLRFTEKRRRRRRRRRRWLRRRRRRPFELSFLPPKCIHKEPGEIVGVIF